MSRPDKEQIMSDYLILRRRVFGAFAAAMFLSLAPMKADLDPAAITYTLPKDIKWIMSSNGSGTVTLAGDPSKPGFYAQLVLWTPHHMARPHFHPNDRIITVISGTWWVGTGSKYDPDSAVAMHAGTVVHQTGKQIHFDGAKDEEAVIEVVGEGPTTATPAETK